MAVAIRLSIRSRLKSATRSWRGCRGLDTAGLDGGDLAEIGLTNGSLSIDDRRTGKTLSFNNINFKLKRIPSGGAALEVSSGGADGRWSLNASSRPNTDGTREVE